MYGRVYKFRVEFPPSVDAPSGESMPVYDQFRFLIGAFNVYEGNRMVGFLSGVGHPMAIDISLGDPFYITPIEGPDGKVMNAVISEKPITVNSVKVNTTEENDDVKAQE